jgi:DNA-binding transcriptional MerR regulator
MNISVGKLGKMLNLSRTTLLYYDSIGLLKPSARSESRYRLYNEDDVEKLKKIIMYREVGLPLDEIPPLLACDDMNISTILIKRLTDLNKEIESIKSQQEIIIRLLKKSGMSRVKKMKRRERIRLVKAAGIDESMMIEWHRQFERHSSEQHEMFLRMLEFTDSEIAELKQQLLAEDNPING